MTKERKIKEKTEEERNTEKKVKKKTEKMEKSEEEKNSKKHKKKGESDSERKGGKSEEEKDKTKEESDRDSRRSRELIRKKSKLKADSKRDKVSLRDEKKEKDKDLKSGSDDEHPKASKREEKKATEREPIKLNFHFPIPKDEVDVSTLAFEPATQKKAILMEEYKVAMEQLLILFAKIMRRGNETTDFDNIKSEKGQTAPERLYKAIYQSTAFWATASEIQPQLNEAVKINTSLIGAAERHLQEKGPKHLRGIKKFVYTHYPRYCDLKKDYAKACKAKPENETAKEAIMAKINRFMQEKYIDAKVTHIGEIQAVMTEIGMYHRAAQRYWFHISERKTTKKSFAPEKFDFSQFYEKKS